MRGDRDLFVNMEVTQYLVDNIHRAKFVSFPGGGHDFHLYYPKEFKRIVEDFLLDDN